MQHIWKPRFRHHCPRHLSQHLLVFVMVSRHFEKSILLPIVEHRLEMEMQVEASESHSQSCREAIDSILLILSVVFTALQFLVLYTAPASPGTHCAVMLAQLASGLRISIPASLPTTAILFIVTPYIARRDSIVTTRYAVLVCYLLGSMLGALLVQGPI